MVAKLGTGDLQSAQHTQAKILFMFSCSFFGHENTKFIFVYLYSVLYS